MFFLGLLKLALLLEPPDLLIVVLFLDHVQVVPATTPLVCTQVGGLFVILRVDLSIVLVLPTSSLVLAVTLCEILVVKGGIELHEVAALARENLIEIARHHLHIKVRESFAQFTQRVSRLRLRVHIIDRGERVQGVEADVAVAPPAAGRGLGGPGVVFEVAAEVAHGAAPAGAHVSEELIEAVVKAEVLVAADVVHDLLKHVLPQLLVHGLAQLS